MNATTQPESTAIVVQQTQQYDVANLDAASLILGPAWDRIQVFAKMMARGNVSVPQHFRGNEADCAAVAMQALGWGMNPFAVAQKTHISQGGQLGYEAQLVNAVIQNSGAVDGDPEYEHFGDWTKVLGKVEERKSDKGGKYYVATYTKADEQGLGVIVRARMRGESKPRELELLMAQAWPRFSTQWATDPKQQICYLALRKFVRLHKPGVILGVNTNDELDGAPSSKFMGDVERVDTPPAKPAYSDEQMAANSTGWRSAIWKPSTEKGEPPLDVRNQRAEQLIKTVSSKYQLSDAQREAIHALVKAERSASMADKQAQDVEPKDNAKANDAPTVTYAQVADQLNKAKSRDQLDEAAALISAVPAEDQREELDAMYENRKGEFA